MRITVLAGGIGSARFVRGLRELGHEITVVGDRKSTRLNSSHT